MYRFFFVKETISYSYRRIEFIDLIRKKDNITLR